MPIFSLRTLGNTFTGSMNSRMTFLFVQYLLTFILIMLAFYFNSQLRFMLNTPPGFETKDIIHAELVYESRDYNYYTPEKIKLRQQRVKAIDKALDDCPDIRSWTASPYYIVGFSYNTGFTGNKNQTVSAVPKSGKAPIMGRITVNRTMAQFRSHIIIGRPEHAGQKEYRGVKL